MGLKYEVRMHVTIIIAIRCRNIIIIYFFEVRLVINRIKEITCQGKKIFSKEGIFLVYYEVLQGLAIIVIISTILVDFFYEIH